MNELIIGIMEGFGFRQSINLNSNKKRKLVRNSNIFIRLVDEGVYAVTDGFGRYILSEREYYYIYIRDAVFKSNGIIEGIYLGNASDNLIDDSCFEVIFNYGEPNIKNASMVVVDNRKGKIIVVNE